MDYLDKLNPMQRQAVTHTEGPLLIFAGAGSGKTRVLTYRIARLIEQGVNPYHIIAITFTNKAAKEMRERVNHITPLGDQVWVSTFHSTCVRLLRRDIHRLGLDGRFSIFDQQDAERLIKTCIQELNLDDKRYPVRYLQNLISAQKNELITPEQFEQSAASDIRLSNVAEAYTLYQRKLVNNNALDFDDIIFYTVELFERQPDVLEKYRDRFRYVMVDEYQDTNTAQYRLVSLLSGYANNLCVVGDDDQSIYGWRGANIKNILQFEEDYPHARVIKLEQNYRSTQTILNAANAVIGRNLNRSAKKLWTENESGGRIHTYKAFNEGEEGTFVAETVRRGVAEGAQYNDYAVLYRNNAQSRAVEDRLVMAGIPYRLYGGVRFYERMEVKDILSYLKAVNNPADNLAQMRIINIPKRGIGGTTVSRILTYATETGMPFSAAIKDAETIPGLKSKAAQLLRFAEFMDDCARYAETNPITALLQKILDDTHYLESLIDGTEEGEGRVENVRELLSKAVEFEQNAENKTLAAFLEEVALVADIDAYEENADTVALMTLHSAKGLEFNRVFIVGFEENIFPAVRSVLSEDPDGLEEERRLCYVGFTRARKTLYLTHAVTRMQYGQTVSNAPSRFLKEVPKEYIETASLRRPEAKHGRAADVSTRKGPFIYGAAGTASAADSGSRFNSGAAFSDTAEPVNAAGLSDTLGRIDIAGQAGSTERIDTAGRNNTPGTARKTAPVNQYLQNLSGPKDKPLDFGVGDRIRQAKYGVGLVTAVSPAGADYEVTVDFERAGIKKFMAHLSRLEKVE